MSDKKQGI
jgi:hypothetical protein